MDLSVSDLHKLASSALAGQGLPAEDARLITEEFVLAELSGLRTHGIGKIPSLNLGDLTGTPRFEQRGPVLRVNGDRTTGLLLMRVVAQRCQDLAQEFGIAIASVRNFGRYSSLYPYTEMLAGAGYVAVLMNSAGPAAVTPYGSADPVTGTNPICFSFPTAEAVQTFDLASAELVWGEIRQASLEGRDLERGPFLDAAGEVTTVPSEVNAVRAFGGPKGAALNLAVEILAGLLTGSPAGLAVDTEFDCGALLLAIDPVATGAASTFRQLVSDLLADIRAARPLDPRYPVRAPGDRGRGRVKLAEVADESVPVADAIVALLERMANGERISELSANPLFN